MLNESSSIPSYAQTTNVRYVTFQDVAVCLFIILPIYSVSFHQFTEIQTGVSLVYRVAFHYCLIVCTNGSKQYLHNPLLVMSVS
jgi:hypothetical protein